MKTGRSAIIMSMAAALVCLASAGCTDPGQTTSITLEKDSVTIPAEGGLTEIGYTIEGDSGSSAPVALCDAEWLSVTVREQDRTIAITADSNTSDEGRRAEITVSCEGCARNESIKVTQLPASPQQPAIILDEDNLEFGKDGGTKTVGYTVTVPQEGTVLQAMCEEKWITADTGKDGQITVTAAANNIPEARTATITLTYGQVQAELNVSVQADGVPSGEAFDIIIHSVTPDAVQYSVIPQDKQAGYMVMIAEKLYFDSFDDEQDYFNDAVDMFRQSAAEKGMDFDEYLRKHVIQSGNDTDNDMYIYETKTMRYVCVNGISEDCKMTTRVYKEVFAEGYEGFNDITFTIEASVDGTDATVTVTPSDDESRYYADVIEKSLIDLYGLEQYMQAKIDQLTMIGEVFGKTAQEVIEETVAYGKETFAYTLDKADTEYVCCAFSLEPYGIINSAIASKTIRTGKAAASDNVITLTISDVNVNTARYKTTTTNDDPYVILFEKASDWKDKTDEEIISGLSEKYKLDRKTVTSDQEDQITGLDGETEYLALAFGFKGGTATTGLVKEHFTTLASAPSEDLVFEISVSAITKFSADITIKATPETALYYWKEVPAGADEEEIKKIIDDAVNQEIWSGFVKDRPEFFRTYGTRGSFTKYKDLYPDTEYKIFAVGVSETTGKYVTDFSYSEPFRTLPVY